MKNATPSDKKQTAVAASGRRSRRRESDPVSVPRDRGSLRLAHQHILGRISSGDLPAGAALSELNLAARLGVSRTPVREAIGQLVAEGILQKSSRGAVVAEPTRQDIIDLYELREALEVYAIGKVAERGLGARELEGLKLLVEQVKTAADELKRSGEELLKGDALQNFLACDLRFHMRLLQASGNARMLRLLDSTSLLLRVFTLRREHHTVKLLGEVYAFHRRILEAVAAGDREKATRLLGEHIRLSRDERLAEYEEIHLARSHGLAPLNGR
jgi:DNA-binding GntR family transcriptional regulator